MSSRTKYLFMLTLLSIAAASGITWLRIPDGAYAASGWTSATMKAFTLALFPVLFFTYFNVRALTGFRWTKLFFKKQDEDASSSDKFKRHALLPSLLLVLFGLGAPYYLFFWQSTFVNGIVSLSVLGAAFLGFLLIPTPEALANQAMRDAAKDMAK